MLQAFPLCPSGCPVVVQQWSPRYAIVGALLQQWLRYFPCPARIGRCFQPSMARLYSSVATAIRHLFSYSSHRDPPILASLGPGPCTVPIWETMLLEISQGVDGLSPRPPRRVSVLELGSIATSPLPALGHSGSQAAHTNTPVKDHWTTLALLRLLLGSSRGWAGCGMRHGLTKCGEGEKGSRLHGLT